MIATGNLNGRFFFQHPYSGSSKLYMTFLWKKGQLWLITQQISTLLQNIKMAYFFWRNSFNNSINIRKFNFPSSFPRNSKLIIFRKERKRLIIRCPQGFRLFPYFDFEYFTRKCKPLLLSFLLFVLIISFTY